jgi:RNA polymerase sigma-70 factor (sigma-E family)
VDGTASFDEFYRATRRRLVTFLYALSSDLPDAHDIAQEAYTRAWQRWRTVGEYADPEAWVRTVAYRLQVNRWRKARNRRTAYRLRGVDPPVAPPSEDTLAVVRALRQLPPDQRHAIALYHLLDLPISEVAAETGVSVSAVKARLARGRNTLSTLLDCSLPEEANHA